MSNDPSKICVHILRRKIFQNSIGGRRSHAAGPGTRPAAATGPSAASDPAGSRRAAATAAGRRSGPGGRSRRAGRAAATAAGRSGRRGGSRGRASRSAAASACVRSVSFVAPGGTRTHNLRLRRATPCPLGHESYEYRHRTAPSRRRPPSIIIPVARVVAPPRRRRAAAAPKVRVPARRVRVVAVAAGRAARAPAMDAR